MTGWNEEHAVLLAAIGGVYALALGAYAFGWAIWHWAVGKFETLVTNHIKHLEDRVKDLEGREDLTSRVRGLEDREEK